MRTKIEWADETVNLIKPVVDGDPKGYHCTKVSDGCAHCYGERMNLNDGFYSWANGRPYDGATYEYAIDEKVIEEVLTWTRKRRRIFLQSMSDPFHEDVPDDLIDEVLGLIAQCPQHWFLILTKRAARMRAYFRHADLCGDYPNLALGVSVENADCLWRVRYLFDVPAAVRFVSIEPMLGPVDLRSVPDGSIKGNPSVLDALTGLSYHPATVLTAPPLTGEGGLDWVIVGGETGPGARPLHPDWVKAVSDQCFYADVPFFFKGWGEWGEVATVSYVKNDKRYTKMGGYTLKRCGRKIAGRLLHGRTFDEYPEALCV